LTGVLSIGNPSRGFSTLLSFEKDKEFRRLRTATKDSVFGNCEPLKSLDANNKS